MEKIEILRSGGDLDPECVYEEVDLGRVRLVEMSACKRGSKVKWCLAESVRPFNLAKSYKC